MEKVVIHNTLEIDKSPLHFIDAVTKMDMNKCDIAYSQNLFFFPYMLNKYRDLVYRSMKKNRCSNKEMIILYCHSMLNEYAEKAKSGTYKSLKADIRKLYDIAKFLSDNDKEVMTHINTLWTTMYEIIQKHQYANKVLESSAIINFSPIVDYSSATLKKFHTISHRKYIKNPREEIMNLIKDFGLSILDGSESIYKNNNGIHEYYNQMCDWIDTDTPAHQYFGILLYMHYNANYNNIQETSNKIINGELINVQESLSFT